MELIGTSNVASALIHVAQWRYQCVDFRTDIDKSKLTTSLTTVTAFEVQVSYRSGF